MKYHTFEEMPVWQKAMELAVRIFQLTESLPRKEDFGLTSQVRRSALSVSGNISEGFGRNHSNDKQKFYFNARGSLAETKNHLIYGERTGYFENRQSDEVSDLIEAIWKELNALISALGREL